MSSPLLPMSSLFGGGVGERGWLGSGGGGRLSVDRMWCLGSCDSKGQLALFDTKAAEQDFCDGSTPTELKLKKPNTFLLGSAISTSPSRIH